ncbi:MAG: hypothetical protein ACI9V8_000463, partial [Urechidicola sp.]
NSTAIRSNNVVCCQVAILQAPVADLVNAATLARAISLTKIKF